MNGPSQLILVLVLVASTVASDGNPGLESGDGLFFDVQSGSGQSIVSGVLSVNISEMSLPVCMDNELLTFNGDKLLCTQLPERNCTCPGPIEGSGVMPTAPLEPPGGPICVKSGCRVFSPPNGGAFLCILISDKETLIYCSVYCDNEHEFFTSPVNPYFCGSSTQFEWEDFTGATYTELPKCDGFRHSLRPLHLSEFYIPRPCNTYFADQADVDKTSTEFCALITFYSRNDCDSKAVSVQCPKSSAVTPAAQNPQVNP